MEQTFTAALDCGNMTLAEVSNTLQLGVVLLLGIVLLLV